jgi:hypothetical protein
MTQPQIIVGDAQGMHNASPPKGRVFKDLSTVCVVPTRGVIPARVVESFMGLISPMNQPFTRIFISGMEVGAAYDTAIATILEHPTLSKWRYVLTLEEDNLVPPDALLKLLEAIEQGYSAVGGLYWTKGEEGQPMCYGKPGEIPEYAPWLPPAEQVTQCNGIGMGCSLFRLDAFRDLERPYLETITRWDPAQGAALATQDLHLCGRLREKGHKIAVDSRVKVGHLDISTGQVW